LLIAAAWLATAPLFSAARGSFEDAAEPPEAAHSGGPGSLRGVYLQSGDEAVPDTGVGRLALQLIDGGATREVSRHYSFRSGDRFRFLVSANRDGWLYVLHGSAASPARVLWPPPPGDPADPGEGANRLSRGAPMPVPSPPAVFVFDDEVGTEDFCVAILSEPTRPNLGALAESGADADAATLGASQSPAPPPRQRPAPAAPAPSEPRIVQFSVRGFGHNSRIPKRGVFIDPKPGDPDPGTYFSVPPQEHDGNLVFVFQLRHEDPL
jgi:hypothetical protein